MEDQKPSGVECPGGMRRVAQSLRIHTPPEDEKRTVCIHGDGSREGTHIVFEGSEAPDEMLSISIHLGATTTGLAAGTIRYSTGEGAAVEEVWVRFGAEPQALFDARSELHRLAHDLAEYQRVDEQNEIESGSDQRSVVGAGA